MLVGDGRVLATGTHEELLATSDEYRSVLAKAALAAAVNPVDAKSVDGESVDRGVAASAPEAGA